MRSTETQHHPRNWGESLDRLRQAWEENRARKPRQQGLSDFHGQVRAILDETGLTRSWKTEELPPLNSRGGSAAALRGPLLVMAKWRKAFWLREIAGLLCGIAERGGPQARVLFQREGFERLWLADPSLAEPPPIAPSRHRPSLNHRQSGGEATPFAQQAVYREWANGGFRARLEQLSPPFRQALGSDPYRPEDEAAFQRHARLLSGISAWLTTEKLGRYGDSAEALARYFENDGELKIRYKNPNSILWPSEREPGDPATVGQRSSRQRIYVDLRLAPVRAQVLVYEASDWDSPWPLRSLPLKEASSSGSEQYLRHSQLTRLDIELALWCEVASRILATLPAMPPATSNPQARKTMNAYDRLLPYQVPIAQAMLDTLRKLERRRPEDPRFASAGWSGRPESKDAGQGDGFSLLPPELTTPVLEDGRLHCQLPWERIAPGGDWMDLRLLALIGADGYPEYLEYEEIEDAEGEGLVCLQLQGTAWEGLQRDHTPERLAAACGEIYFAYAPSPSGNGAFVMGVVNLGIHSSDTTPGRR